jgi:lipopolysaccharide/colanic/teichoic acid biosynthesis glycosyltransferase
VVVGSGSIARELANKIERHPEMLCEIAGFLFPDDGPADGSSLFEVKGDRTQRISTLAIVDLLRSKQIDELIVALSQPTSAEVLTLTGRCREAGIRVSLVPQPYDLYLSRPVLLDLDGLPLLQLTDPSPASSYLRCKRLLDLTVGSVLSLLALPIVLSAAVVLRLSKGRAFCWDIRSGKHGESFHMLRMNVQRRPPHENWFEQLLAESSVSELPQLWNVLCGDMSLVGPRPESPNRAKRYTDWQQRRLSVKPGITGLAQVYGLRDYSSSEDKTRFDLQYLLYPSLLADVSLLMQTGWTLTRRVSRLGAVAQTQPKTTTAYHVEAIHK